MKVLELGCNEKPVVVLIHSNNGGVNAIAEYLEPFYKYYFFVVFYEIGNGDTKKNQEEAGVILSDLIERYQGNVLALCSLANGWKITQKLLCSKQLHYSKLILESKKIQPGTILLALLGQMNR